MDKLHRNFIQISIPILISLTMLLAACIPSGAAPASSPTPAITQAPTAVPSPATAQVQASAAPDPIHFQSSLAVWAANKPPTYADSTSTNLSVTSEHALNGQQSLELVFDFNEGLKALFSLERPIDLSNAARLYIELSDPDGVLDSVAVALSTGTDWLWHEAVPQKVQTGDNSLTFDLAGSDFSTAATGWKPGARLANLDQVQRLSVILFPKKSGKVYLQSVRTSSTGQPGSEVTLECPLPPKLPANSPPLGLYLPQSAKPQQYVLLEFDLAAAVQPKNSFDPDEIDLLVHYTAPDGKTFTIPAFWYQAYDSTGGSPCGQPGWKARLTPFQAGPWSAQAELRGQGLVSDAVVFQVAASDSKGFVRIHPTNPRYLAFDNGQTFFPIGLNIGWWQTDPLKDYPRWLDKLQANHGSVIRVWMASWSFAIEWNDTGLGDYTHRLRQAWLLDQVFSMAEQRDIFIELVLLNHGAFSETVNPEWENNPYNSANGGPCLKPECFVSDAQAKQYFQRRLRYIAARWGYSPNLLAWEWWNEENWTPIQPKDLAPWIQEMTAYLRQYDPYRHLVSASFSGNNPKEVAGLAEIDFTQLHLYSTVDPMDNFPSLYQDESAVAPSKPVLFAEFGNSTGGENTESYDKTGDHLHMGLWSATFSGFASPAMYWWWDSFIEPLDLWGQYNELYTFIQDEDLATLAPGKPKVNSTLYARALSLQNPRRALVWVKNNLFVASQLSSLLDKKVQGFQVTLSGLEDGSYRVRWYEPASMQWLGESTVQSKDGALSLTAPDFNRDLAAKIEFVP
jgi:hypothetical protein